MPTEITVPRLGWSMEEGAFVGWLKSEGEMVREGDGLFELEGDKATQVVESFDAGILRIAQDAPQPGDVVRVGQILGHLEARATKSSRTKTTGPQTTAPKTTAPQPGSNKPSGGVGEAAAASPAITAASAAPAPGQGAASPPVKASASAAAAKTPRHAVGMAIASPSVRRLARELGLDLQAIGRGGGFPISAADLLKSACRDAQTAPQSATRSTVALPVSDRPVTPRAKHVARELGVETSRVVGTGRNGRIREQDVRAAASNGASSAPAASTAMEKPARGQPLTQLRRVIARRMMAASHETAPVTLTARADATELVHFREQCKLTSVERGMKPPSYAELFVKLSAAALEKHRPLLDQWIEERLVPAEGVHIAVAVATAQGLVTPVIRDVPALSLRELSTAFDQLVQLARAGRLAVEQMQGGAFTVSSLGGYRVDAFTPILNPPQTAILGIGRISEEPVVKQNQLAVANIVHLSLTFDHRVVDGAPAAAFLTSLCELIESPLSWLLA
ncbi:MAG: 2-oxo acid dehydrogenase subunit E2 [Pirellulales bacterium]|nr:2-oxo acid dehydrogenase subunit E2 [Pirellulales bacterium]